jgi:Predicted RNA-binding protein of the translin family
LSSLEKIIGDVKTELMAKNKIRESTHEDMRKATSQSKQSILLIHRKRIDDAEKMLSSAKQLICNLQKQADANPDIVSGGMLSAAQQEYAEANILLTLVKEDRFVTPSEISIPSVDYVLGLADVIGEYRRLALDYLREGEVEKGVRCLEIMDEIFIQLLALDEAYMLVPGLRHKSDASRRIIEATRGDITLEVRRKSLEDELKKFTPPTTEAKGTRKRAKAKA